MSIQDLIIDPVNAKLHEILESVTLQDLENDYLQKTEYSSDMYYI